uniref:Uncharacterized protein n=1 Tax=Chrysotila carterae TaxID=13221 RepID=A0A7S4F2G3_CHRCT
MSSFFFCLLLVCQICMSSQECTILGNPTWDHYCQGGQAVLSSQCITGCATSSAPMALCCRSECCYSVSPSETPKGECIFPFEGCVPDGCVDGTCPYSGRDCGYSCTQACCCYDSQCPKSAAAQQEPIEYQPTVAEQLARKALRTPSPSLPPPLLPRTAGTTGDQPSLSVEHAFVAGGSTGPSGVSVMGATIALVAASSFACVCVWAAACQRARAGSCLGRCRTALFGSRRRLPPPWRRVPSPGQRRRTPPAWRMLRPWRRLRAEQSNEALVRNVVEQSSEWVSVSPLVANALHSGFVGAQPPFQSPLIECRGCDELCTHQMGASHAATKPPGTLHRALTPGLHPGTQLSSTQLPGEQLPVPSPLAPSSAVGLARASYSPTLLRQKRARVQPPEALCAFAMGSDTARSGSDVTGDGMSTSSRDPMHASTYDPVAGLMPAVVAIGALVDARGGGAGGGDGCGGGGGGGSAGGGK